MTQKIIVADDSQTIQKVVAITLANDSFELVSCTNENELTLKIAANDFALVLLDFNLSDNKDGYQLAALIKRAAPGARIMAMMGTFDQIDEAKMRSSGIDDYISKPFDSNMFIQKCRSLTSGDDFNEMNSDEAEEGDWDEDTKEDIRLDSSFTASDSEDEADLEENWVVDSSQVSQEVETAEEDESDHGLIARTHESQNELQNELQDELMGWGIPVPTKIGSASSASLMPPVIADNGSATLEEGIQVDLSEDQTSVESDEAFPEVVLEEGESLGRNPFDLLETQEDQDEQEETTLPADDDLDYPDLDDVGSSQDDLKDIKLSSHLVAVDELAPESDSSPSISFDDDSGEVDLASQIASEVSPDDFWAADEVVTSSTDAQEASVGGAIANPDIAHSVDEHAVNTDHDALAPLESNLTLENTQKKSPAKAAPVTQAPVEIDEEKLVAKLKDSLAPMIEEMIKNQMEMMMKERVDHIAWEVIPDLAENLIRDEIKNISTQI